MALRSKLSLKMFIPVLTFNLYILSMLIEDTVCIIVDRDKNTIEIEKKNFAGRKNKVFQLETFDDITVIEQKAYGVPKYK